MHEVLVNRLGSLSLPRKSVVRLTDRPDMTIDVYRGRKTTIQQQHSGLRRRELIFRDLPQQHVLISDNSRVRKNYFLIITFIINFNNRHCNTNK